MIPLGSSLLWVLWLILGTGAMKARALVQSQPGEDWAGGREGDTDTARIPSKAWPNIVKKDERGLVGETINSEEEEEDKLVGPAAAELLEASVSSISGKEQEESQELDEDEQKEDDENDRDLEQEDEDQDQELNQKEEQKTHSRDSGQDQGQAQKIGQVKNREQGDIQEIEEEQQEESGEKEQRREKVQEQMRGLEEEGLREDEEAGGLGESPSLGHELKQIPVQRQVNEQQQIQVQEEEEEQPIQDLGQKQEPLLAKEPQAKKVQPIQVPAVGQLAQEHQQIQEGSQIPVYLEGSPPRQVKEQVFVLEQAPAPTPGPAQEQLLLKAFEQASIGLSPGPLSNKAGFFPSPGLRAYEPQQPPPEWEPSNLGPVPPPETHLGMLAWGPWECHCSTGTMSRVREGKFLGFARRLRSGVLSRLQTQSLPCTYALCHCNQEKKECPSDHASCSSTPGACNPRASLTLMGNPENTVNETTFWKQIREGLEEVWVGLQSLVTEKRINRNQR